MRILVHDFGGYAFPLQLSRALVDRGHEVMHTYCASLETTPSGVDPAAPAPANPILRGIALDEPLHKYNFLKRWRQERAYGRLIVQALDAFGPKVVLSANTPLDAQGPLLRASRARGIRFVFWLQDLLGVATRRILARKMPGPGHLIGAWYDRLEGRLLRESDAVVAISEGFRDALARHAVDPARIHVIPNWADLAAIPVLPKRNAWSEAHGLADAFCFLYAGTLGMKHNPGLLLQLARAMQGHDDARVVVVSQGIGATWLEAQKRRLGLDRLVLLPYQPLSDVPAMLASADVLVGLLEPDAGQYSVPSKVLTYLCAGRPLLLAMPATNDAARPVDGRTGFVVDPSDTPAFLRAAEALYQDADRRAAFGRAARLHAEASFDMERIAEQLARVLVRVP